MTRNEAKLELFKVDRKIETAIVRHTHELGRHNKQCWVTVLHRLWDRKKTLQNIINS